MGWESTYGVSTRKAVIEQYKRDYENGNCEVLKIANNGNWWLIKAKKTEKREKEEIYAIRMLFSFRKSNREMMVKTICLEDGPNYKGFPKSWIPMLDLNNKERYHYNQLENIMKQETNYIPQIGDCIMSRDGLVVKYTGRTFKGAKYKYYFDDGYRRDQETVNVCRERFLKRCVPVVV